MAKEGLFLFFVSLFLNQVIPSFAFCDNDDQTCKLNGGTIAGIVIGCLIAVLIIVVAVLLACSHARMSMDEDFFIEADPVVVSQDPNGSTRISIPHQPRYVSSNRTRGSRPNRNSPRQSNRNSPSQSNTPQTVLNIDRQINTSNGTRTTSHTDVHNVELGSEERAI